MPLKTLMNMSWTRFLPTIFHTIMTNGSFNFCTKMVSVRRCFVNVVSNCKCEPYINVQRGGNVVFPYPRKPRPKLGKSRPWSRWLTLPSCQLFGYISSLCIYIASITHNTWSQTFLRSTLPCSRQLYSIIATGYHLNRIKKKVVTYDFFSINIRLREKISWLVLTVTLVWDNL